LMPTLSKNYDSQGASTAIDSFVNELLVFDPHYRQLLLTEKQYPVNFQKWFVLLYYEGNTEGVLWILENMSTYGYRDEDAVRLFTEVLSLHVDESQRKRPLLSAERRIALFSSVLDLLFDLYYQADEQIEGLKALPKERVLEIIEIYRTILCDLDVSLVFPLIGHAELLLNLDSLSCTSLSEKISVFSDESKYPEVMRVFLHFLMNNKNTTRNEVYKSLRLLSKKPQRQFLVWIIANHNQPDIDLVKNEFLRETNATNYDFMTMLLSLNRLDDLVAWLQKKIHSFELNVKTLGLPQVMILIHHMIEKQLFSLLAEVLVHLENLDTIQELNWDVIRPHIDVNTLYVDRLFNLWIHQKKKDQLTDPLLDSLKEDNDLNFSTVLAVVIEQGSEALFLEMIKRLAIPADLIVSLYADIADAFGLSGLKKMYARLPEAIKTVSHLHERFLRSFLSEEKGVVASHAELPWAPRLALMVTSLSQLNRETQRDILHKLELSHLIDFVSRVAGQTDQTSDVWHDFLTRLQYRVITTQHPIKEAEHQVLLALYLQQDDSSFFLYYFSHFSEKIVIPALTGTQKEQLIKHVNHALLRGKVSPQMELFCWRAPELFFESYVAYKVHRLAEHLSVIKDLLAQQEQDVIDLVLRKQITNAQEYFHQLFTCDIPAINKVLLLDRMALRAQVQHYIATWNPLLSYIRQHAASLTQALSKENSIFAHKKNDAPNIFSNKIPQLFLWDVAVFLQSHTPVQQLLAQCTQEAALSQLGVSLIGHSALTLFMQASLNHTIEKNGHATELRLSFDPSLPPDDFGVLINSVKNALESCFANCSVELENIREGKQNRRIKISIKQDERLVANVLLTDDYFYRYWTNSCILIDLTPHARIPAQYQMKPTQVMNTTDLMGSFLNKKIELPVLDWHEPLQKAEHSVLPSWVFLFSRIHTLAQTGFTLSDDAKKQWLQSLTQGSADFWKRVLAEHHYEPNLLLTVLPGLREKVGVPASVAKPVVQSAPQVAGKSGPEQGSALAGRADAHAAFSFGTQGNKAKKKK